jgi:nucleotide-binding universal stress UspA family protein
MEKAEKNVLEGKVFLESTMVRLTNILVGMDFSAASERALDNALALARRYEARIYLVNVITSDSDVMLAPELMTLGHEREVREAQEKMGEILISGRLRGVAHETVIEHGSLWPTIEVLIGKHQIDLVVVGTEGVGGLQKMLLGSGAEQIFRQAMCPVLTVGPAVTGGARRRSSSKTFCSQRILGLERNARRNMRFRLRRNIKRT